ncbi:prepilin-type N-terminal cleavage/methylation domain-containing protein [Neokomagataea tanensis]|uniref:Prepilin-type N-terminal cleavage/methylation domain-containing protein n=1 Tax=Neokomagataea tanensis TaxID=661191 RepID=A0A4Y6V5D4_9PROT|nr:MULTISPECIES: prepilin-type N-terminal cleavage/methylation domain-containing protein [Neokomagataea]QDH25322.1 prepilin-type N-terminal cleavage/methylation domain-containing protein [Neokomagataea tanensis]
MTEPAHPDSGFTLLEIMVVLVVFGLLSLALWTGIGVGTRGWRSGEQLSVSVQQAQDTEDVLRRVLTRADISDEGGAPSLTGEGDRLRAVSWLAQGGGYAHEAEIGLGVNAKKQLVLRWRTYVRTRCPRPDEAYQEEILISGLQGVDFSYFGMADGSMGWHKSWSSTSLPQLVRVHFHFIKAGQRWPDILIHPLLSGNAEPS